MSIKTVCAICGCSMIDDCDGKYVPLCSENCENSYENPPPEPKRDFMKNPCGDESYFEE